MLLLNVVAAHMQRFPKTGPLNYPDLVTSEVSPVPFV